MAGGEFPQAGNFPGVRFVGSVFLILLTFGQVARPETVCDEIERTIVGLCNQQRRQIGLPELEWDGQLAQAARGHSQDMAERNFFDHTSPVRGKRDSQARVALAGSKFTLIGENLYWASGHPPDRVPTLAMNNWMKSAGHRENILGGEYHHVGVGVFRRQEIFWITQVFSE